jgi:predicted nucleic-acid-binding Zn-ribbon protein
MINEAYYLLGCETMQYRRSSLMKNAVFWDVTPCGSCKKTEFYVVTAVKTSNLTKFTDVLEEHTASIIMVKE